MSGIRELLSIFSREVRRPASLDLADPARLEKYLRGTQDAQVADMLLQQAGHSPFWPQTPDMRARFDAWRMDDALGPLLRQAASISMGARRHLLASLYTAPDPVFESFLPRVEESRLLIAFADRHEPEQLHFAWHLAAAAPASWHTDMLDNDDAGPILTDASSLLTCRDDRDLIQRGWGPRLHKSYAIAILSHDAAQRLLARGPSGNPVAFTPSRGLAEQPLADDDALAALIVTSRHAASYGGNRALRQIWQHWEETGRTSRIGAGMGLSLGDMQDVYEVLSRNDLPADARLRHRVPHLGNSTAYPVANLCRIQDRALAKPLQNAAPMHGPEHDSA